MNNLQKNIKSNWNPPKINKSKKVTLLFKVGKDGQLLALKVYKSSGNSLMDKAALKAVKNTAPFAPLPREFKGKAVDIQFDFAYNAFNNKKP
jgi:protein TonB